MNDSPSSQLCLSVPSRQYQTKKCLTSITRDQEFKVWLVVRNVDTSEVYPIKCISWQLSARVAIDPLQEQGERAIAVDPEQKPPVIHKTAHQIPFVALVSPECNKAQALIWRPTDPKKKVSVIVPPAWEGAPPLTMKDLQNPFLKEEERTRLQMMRQIQEHGRFYHA